MRKKEIRPLSPEDQEYVRNFLQINDPLIRRVVARYMHPNTPAEFEDLLQNTHEAICRQLDVFKTCENPEPLLRTIAMRQVWATNRKHRPTVPLLDTVSAPTEDRGLDELLPTSTPAADRELFEAVYVRRETLVELAAEKGCKPTTMHQRAKRARDHLRKELEKIGM